MAGVRQDELTPFLWWRVHDGYELLAGIRRDTDSKARLGYRDDGGGWYCEKRNGVWRGRALKYITVM